MISLPNTQALNSKTFRVPQALADDSLALPELYDWHSENSPSHPLFVFEDRPESMRTIFWPEAVRAIHRAAYRVSSAIQDDTSLSTRIPVIAILAATDTITYFCFMAGILRAGYTVFPISPRNSPQAIAHLLRKTGAIHLFASGDSQLQSLACTSIELIQATGEANAVKIYETPVFGDLFPHEAAETSFIRFPVRHFDLEMPALILHSSGTTAFPKPVVWSHRGVLTFAKIPYFGEIDLCGLVIGCHSMPMFHGMGVLQLATVAACGVVLSVFKPTFPAIIPTSKNVFEGAVATYTDVLAGVPAFVEAWSCNPDYVNYMKTIKGVMYGGGPLNTECGNFLASQGISIYINYGSTECGPMCTFLRANPGMDWEYFTFSGHTRPELLAYPDGTVELIMMKHALHTPCVLNFKVAGVDAYRTHDLLIPHPTRVGLWKIFGRADDQIMLSTGEKTNPVPLETILCQDIRVKSAVMFGRGQLQNGVIVDPSQDFIFDPKDSSLLAEFLDAIWVTVEQLNAHAPTHSRLFKEMILVASPSKPFTYTAKATPLRQAIIADYDREIEALYDAMANATPIDVPVPKDWKQLHALHFVRNIVRKLLKKTVDDEDDIFQHGCDSLQATRIRNSILRTLRETKMAEVARGLPENLIYQFPTVSSLASCVSKSVLGSVNTQAYVEADRIQEMLDKVDKYSSFRVQRTCPLIPNAVVKGDIVLLTGSTGGFGCNILAQLVISETVAKIYALNRPSFQGTPLSNRQADALQDHGFNPDALLNPKVVLVECDLTLPMLGISTSLLEEIRDSVTHIIHNAWRVDFNLSLQSFEDNICALKSLVDLALASPHPTPPRLMFVSSIGIFRHPSQSGLVPETPIIDPHVAMGGGYTESKWVSEAILARAAQQTPLRPIIVRLGQLTGSGNGYWNQREWFPSMVKSAVMSLNCLPNLDGSVSWMPSYEAAAALIEMCNSPYDILHLVHPRPVSWTSLITPIAKNIGVPLVSFPEWLDALNNSIGDTSTSEVERMHHNPALKLMEFFRHADLDKNKEPLGVARLNTEYACEVSKTLNVTMNRLDERDAITWVDAWRRRGFF